MPTYKYTLKNGIKVISPKINLDGKDETYINAAYVAVKDIYFTCLDVGSSSKKDTSRQSKVSPDWQSHKLLFVFAPQFLHLTC